MTPTPEAVAFARLITALGPYRDHLVVIGGWAHRLSRLHPLAQPVDFPPLFTQDVDLAIGTGIPQAAEALRTRLLDAGFTERFVGEDRPPITHYQLGAEGPSMSSSSRPGSVGRRPPPTRWPASPRSDSAISTSS